MTGVVIGLLALFSIAWLSAASAAVRSVSRIWLRHWVEQHLQGAVRGEPYLDRPQSLLAVSSALSAGAVGILGATVGATVTGAGRLAAAALLGAVAVLIVGQAIPRAVGRHWAMSLAPILLPPLRTIERAMGRFVAARSSGGDGEADGRAAAVARARIEDLLREGELEGIGGHGEIAIITGVLDFGAKLVADVMTPRSAVFALASSTPPKELAARIAASGFSRVPVTGEGLDEVIGMVHVFDVLKAGGTRMPPVRPVAFAAATQRCSELLVAMQRQRVHLAVVRDDQQHTVGIVTLEDLLEELVGDISDEHDEPHDAAVVAGRATLMGAA